MTFIKYEFIDEEASKKNPMYRIRKANLETESTLKELEETYKDPIEVNVKLSAFFFHEMILEKKKLSKIIFIIIKFYLLKFLL